jgi:hypothetical protein
MRQPCTWKKKNTKKRMLFSHPYIYSHTSIHPYIHPEWGALLGAAGSHWGLINKVRELFIYFSENILLSFWQT